MPKLPYKTMGLCLILLVIIALFIIDPISIYKPPIQSQIQGQSQVQPAHSSEERLSKWVYEHSSKISKRTADALTKQALKTDKELLILAIISVESEFTPTAISNVGAVGLGQIMWDVWGKDLIKAGIAKEKRDLFDLDVNIQATNYVLDACIKEGGGDIGKALTKYLGADKGYYKNRVTETLGTLYLLSIKKESK